MTRLLLGRKSHGAHIARYAAWGASGGVFHLDEIYSEQVSILQLSSWVTSYRVV